MGEALLEGNSVTFCYLKCGAPHTHMLHLHAEAWRRAHPLSLDILALACSTLFVYAYIGFSWFPFPDSTVLTRLLSEQEGFCPAFLQLGTLHGSLPMSSLHLNRGRHSLQPLLSLACLS